MRMSIWPQILMVAILPSLATGEATQVCAPLSDKTNKTLSNYVKAKYRLPEITRIKITEIESPDERCYRTLRFRSSEPNQNFNVKLFLSPDQRYLSGTLFDTGANPIQEDKKANAKFRRQLTEVNAPASGTENAVVTLVVFSDFQCPYCKSAADLLEKDVLPREKNVRLVFRHFPLRFHSWARAAAEASACAHRQSTGAFWSFHDYLFAHQAELTPGNLAAKLTAHSVTMPNFDTAQFHNCIIEHQTKETVQRDLEFALDNDINGTPTVFINGMRMRWAGVPEQVHSLIRQMERKQPTASVQGNGLQ